MPLLAVIAPPAVAALVNRAPALLRPVPLSEILVRVSTPVCCQSRPPPALMVRVGETVAEFVPLTGIESVPAAVKRKVPPLLTVILPECHLLTVVALVIENIPPLTVKVPVPDDAVVVMSKVPLPVLVRFPVATMPPDKVKVAPVPILIVAPDALTVSGTLKVAARFGSKIKAPVPPTPVPAIVTYSELVPPMPRRKAPPVLTFVPSAAPPAQPKASKLIVRTTPLLISTMPL